MKLLGDGEDNKAKLLWLEKALSWDWKKLTLWSSEENMFYKHLNNLFQIQCSYTCEGSNCPGQNKLSNMSTIDIVFKSPAEIEEIMGTGRLVKHCPWCKKASVLSHSFVNEEPLPFIVFSMSIFQCSEETLQEFYKIIGHRYKIFAYSLLTAGHFTTIFRRGKLLMEYDGLHARTSTKLKKHTISNRPRLNIIWLIFCPTNSVQI